jgi:NADH-quinone oxidoreductase subunit N
VTPISAPPIALGALLPILILAGTGMLVLLADLLPPRESKQHLGALALAGIIATLVTTLWRWGSDARGFHDMVRLDGYALFFDIVIAYAAALVVLLSMDYLRRRGAESGEYYALVLFSTCGMMLLASAADLIIVFLGIELMSLSLYVLAGLFKRRRESSEASMKYFLLGVFASAFLLYGIALLFGAAGSTNFERLAGAAARGPHDPLLLAGVGLLLVGFGFKIAAVPFHMWAPDVYEGAPTSVTALIATGSKAAVFAALIRVFAAALKSLQPDWTMLLWVLAAVTMTLGNVVAIAQANLKRMLAYSSIAHVGYMLMGLVAAGPQGTSAVLFYLFSYMFTTVGAFGVITLCERPGSGADADGGVEVRECAGLGRRSPALAFALTFFLLSLIGVPPLAGFFAKFYLFGAAVKEGYVWLTVIAVLNSAIAAYYYLRVVVYLYMRDPEGVAATMVPSFPGGLALAIAFVGIVLLGVMPAPFVDLAQIAVAPLLR